MLADRIAWEESVSLSPNTNDDTESLLARCAAGNAEAVSQLLEQHRPFLRRIVELRLDPSLRGRVDPSDVVQETQLEVMRRIVDYVQRRPMSFRVWLHHTTCQRLTTLWRHHRRTRRRSVDREVVLPEESSIALARHLLAESPSERLQQHELAQKVQDAVSRLAPMDKEIVLLRNFEELTNQESAERLGIDEAAASKRYGRALLRLRTLLHEASPH